MGERITRSVVVHQPVTEVYNLWANFDNFPNFMSHIKEVRKTGNNISHWVMEGPMGKDVEWDAKTTAMEPNRRIVWNSVGGDVDTSGEVTFREMGNQTEVTVMMTYAAKGAVADMVAKYFTNTGDWMEEDLRNFKHYAEQMGERTGTTGRSSFASDEPDTYGTRGTGLRERSGAGAMGSTPGGPMNTPVGGAIGGTTGGREAGPSSTTGGTFGGTSTSSTQGIGGTSPGGTGINRPGETKGTGGTSGTGSSYTGGKGTSSTSGGTRSGSVGGPTNDRSISGDREHSDPLNRDIDRDRNRDLDEGIDRDRNRDNDPDRDRGKL